MPCYADFKGIDMDSMDFRAFLDLLMCSDPWPVHDELGGETGQEALLSVANRMAMDYGFTDWLDAYHRHVA